MSKEDMQVGVSLRRNAAAAVAVAALFWLVMAVNSLGDDAQRGAAFLLRQPPAVPLVIRDDATGGGGLDLIDMYQCMCTSASDDGISLWVKWWLIAAVFGGMPTAFLIRTKTAPLVRD